ncbi:hypothetical protein F53441_13961 [Fusarium austroafricanum]|uniref:Uncharacterized protein n=1 Tax=Fusarium austroafricanum TaxID=2364996 RepID=A0A8H4JIG1_9HYPO|nr:hypothetical protein F53441_13961 [Fusarium austroafricanum]
MKHLFVTFLGLTRVILAAAAPHESLALRETTSPALERRAPLRHIEFDTFVRIRDDEPWPDSDDYFNRDQPPRTISIGGTVGDTRRDVFEARAGGEIRLKVTTWFHLTESFLLVQYYLQLYEGTSESTTDLDGTRVGCFIVPPGQRRDVEDSVRNTAENDDDTGTVHFWVTNRA